MRRRSAIGNEKWILGEEKRESERELKKELWGRDVIMWMYRGIFSTVVFDFFEFEIS